MPFIAIREARDLARDTLRLSCAEDHSLLVDLAAASQMGQGVSMKQLVILHGGSATTVRRRVARLIAAGHVVKQPNPADARSDCFQVSPTLQTQLPALEAAFSRISINFQHRRLSKATPALTEHTTMSHWDRRYALEMADAITNKINHADTSHTVRFALKPIAMECAKASLTNGTPQSMIHTLRANLCTVCKSHGLHQCDPTHSWPVRCAFMDTNLT